MQVIALTCSKEKLMRSSRQVFGLARRQTDISISTEPVLATQGNEPVPDLCHLVCNGTGEALGQSRGIDTGQDHGLRISPLPRAARSPAQR
jgi:hypothetical protein